jgi:hypothetical protein
VYTIHHPPHSAGNRPKNKQHRCGMYAEKWECIPIRGRGNCACPVRNMIEHVASMCINSGGSTKPRMPSLPHASSSLVAIIFPIGRRNHLIEGLLLGSHRQVAGTTRTPNLGVVSSAMKPPRGLPQRKALCSFLLTNPNRDLRF